MGSSRWRVHAMRVVMIVSASGLLALVLLLIASHRVDAGLVDNETPPNPLQYQDWDHAYNLTPAEQGVSIIFRRDGNGDEDYFRFTGLSLMDLVTIEVYQSNRNATVDYWISDPNRFPIWLYSYDGSPEVLPLKFEFFVAIGGAFYFNTGDGMGESLINLSFTISQCGHPINGNDEPTHAELIHGNTTKTAQLEQPYDTSDFFRLNLSLTNESKLFLSLNLTYISGGAVRWELYNSTGARRPSKDYQSDALIVEGTMNVLYRQVQADEDLYIRIWAKLGSPTVSFRILVNVFPADHNDDPSTAPEVRDGDIVNGTVNTILDVADWFRIALVPGDNLSLWLENDDDADLFLIFNGYQKAISDQEGNATEHIRFEVPAGEAGWYYIVVKPYLVTDLDRPHTIHYSLKVRTNLDPVVHTMAGKHIITEDTVDETLDLSQIFSDPEGGPLTYRIVGGSGSGLLDITLINTRLRIVPAPNASGFEDKVTVEAKDDHGYTARYTIELYVMPVDDPPQIGPPGAISPPDGIALDEDGLVGPFNVAAWFWDVDDPFWTLAYSIEAPPQLEPHLEDGLLTLRAVVPDWWGGTSIRITASDPSGSMASLVMPVTVRPVNDPPQARWPSLLLTAMSDRFVVDIGGFFADADGDVLAYTVEAPSDLSTSFAGGNLTVTGLHAYVGRRAVLNLTAADPSGARSGPLQLTIFVQEAPFPGPLPVSLVPDRYNVTEGSALLLVNIIIVDDDPLPRSYDVIVRIEGFEGRFPMRVSASGTTWSSGPPTWTPDVKRKSRDVEGILTVMKGTYSSNVSFSVRVLRLNHAPEVQKVEFDRMGPYREGDMVVASGRVVDADSDPLQYQWFFDGKELDVNGSRAELRDVTTGIHHVRLVVSDGCATAENTGSFLVLNRASPAGSNTMTGLIVAWAMVAILAVAYVLFRRWRTRQGGPE